MKEINMKSPDILSSFLNKIYQKSKSIESLHLKELNKTSYIGYNGLLSEFIKDVLNTIHDNNYYIVSTDILIKAISQEFNFETINMENELDCYEQLCNFFGVKHYANSTSGEYLNIIIEKIPKTFGEEMENLYFNDANLIGIHGTSLPSETIENEIFQNGLICNYGNDLICTVATKDTTLSFSKFLRYVYKPLVTENAIIICIPNKDLKKTIWKETNTQACILNPKYIYGYYLSHQNALFNQNVNIIHNSRYLVPDYDQYYNITDKTLSSSKKHNL